MKYEDYSNKELLDASEMFDVKGATYAMVMDVNVMSVL